MPKLAGTQMRMPGIIATQFLEVLRWGGEVSKGQKTQVDAPYMPRHRLSNLHCLARRCRFPPPPPPGPSALSLRAWSMAPQFCFR